ncbi:MAG: hypothetical protein JXB88_00600 [Spirochaetales bacterium]|nr:hypothetical protein [Spirochaetales bacterium]
MVQFSMKFLKDKRFVNIWMVITLLFLSYAKKHTYAALILCLFRGK